MRVILNERAPEPTFLPQVNVHAQSFFSPVRPRRNPQASRSDATVSNNNTERPSEIHEYSRENAAVEVNQNYVSRSNRNNNDYIDK